MNGHFAVRSTSGTLNTPPSDQVIEQTINKEQKVAGEIIKIFTLTRAEQRWILSSRNFAEMISSFRSSIRLNQFKSKSKDFGKTRIKKDEAAAGRCYNIIKL